MADCNPCCCWNLKDGCITIGIWSLVWSIIQMGIFSWQTAVMKWLRDKIENRRVPGYNSYTLYDNRLGGGDWNEYYYTPEEKIYMALFIIQIVNLIAAFFLLFASVALIYGIHTSSKYLIWPWFPCIVASIVCSITYCVVWWVGNVVSYWLALTIIEFLGVVINVYCLICVFLQYRRILKGYVQHTYEEDYKPKQVIYEYRTSDESQQEVASYHRRDDDYYREKPGIEGYLNATYEHEPYSGTKVSVYQGADEDALMKPFETVIQDVNIEETREFQIVTTGGATAGGEEPEFKDIFTEEWLKNVMSKGPTADDKITERPSSRRSKSEDGKRKKHEHHKPRSKSKDSVRSKRSHRSASRNEGSSYSGDEGKTKSEKSRRSKSEGGERHKHHHHRRKHDDETETKVSRSAIGESERTSRKDKDKDERKHQKKKESDLKRHKRPRDVKREDKERAAGKTSTESQTVQRPDSSSTDRTTLGDGRQLGIVPGGGATGFPSYMLPPGTISIPQQIVIPPQPNRPFGKPQNYQISSEVTINYSDKSAPPSDNEGRRNPVTPQVRQLPTPLLPKAPSPQSMISTAAIATQTSNHRNGGSTGGDSKSHGSTAV